MTISEINREITVGETQVSVLENEQNTNIVKEEGVTYVEVAPLELINHSGIYPMKNQVPHDIFNRKYMLYNDTMTPNGDGEYGNYLILYPWDIFGTVSASLLYEYIDMFSFFRSDVEVEILIECPIAIFGFLTAFFVPCGNIAAQPAGSLYNGILWPEFVQMESGYSAVSDNESIKMTIPYRSFRPYIPVNGVDFDYDLWGLGSLIINFAAGDSVGHGAVPPTIGVQVFVKPVNTVLTGPVYKPPFLLRKKKKKKKIQLQSSIQDAAIRTMTKIAADKTSDVISSLATAAEGAFCDMTGLCGNVNQSEDEGNERKGVKNAVYGDTSSLTSNHASYQILGDYDLRPTPQALVANRVEPDNIYSLCRRWAYYGNGTCTSAGSALKAVNWIGHPRMTPPFQDRRPAGYIPYFSRFFKFWRGAFEFKVIFFGPILLTLRAQILLALANAPFPGYIAGPIGVGNSVTYTVTAKGTTEMIVRVPYIYEKVWQSTYPSDVVGNDYPYHRMILRSFPYHVPDVLTYIPFIVLWRTGTDFLFSGLQSGGKEQAFASETPIALQGLFNGETESAETGDGSKPPEAAFVERACPGDIMQLLARASVRETPSLDSFSGPGASTTTGAGWAQGDLFDQLTVFYVYWSGSMDFKATYSSTYPEAGYDDFIALSIEDRYQANTGYQPSSFRSGNPTQVLATRIWPVAEVTLPFYHEYMCAVVGDKALIPQESQPLTLRAVNKTQTVLPDPNVLVKPGKDFQLYVRWPPPYELNLPVITPK